MDWFRLYDSIIDDPKILQLSDEFRWLFVVLLSISSRQSERGSLPNQSEIAIHMRVTKSKCKRVISRFIELGFIDVNKEEGTLSVHGWDSRQRRSDSSAERVARHRDRYSERSCNVTNPLPHVCATETETDKERNPLTPFSPPDDEGEPFHPPPMIVTQDSPRARSGKDLAGWNAAILLLRETRETETLAAEMEIREANADVCSLEGWRFYHAGRVVRPPGKPKNWAYFMSVARGATRQEYENWATRRDGPRPRPGTEPRRLPPAPADSIVHSIVNPPPLIEAIMKQAIQN